MSHWRTKLGVLFGAGALVMVATSTALAVAPTYTIEVTKTADPASVPASGGTVEYTILVENTGTGDFQAFTVDDGMAGCTLGAATGDTDTDGKLDPGETWAYTCTVENVMPGTLNTATVTACNGGGECVADEPNSDTEVAGITVTEVEATDDPGATDDTGATAGPGATEANTATDLGAVPGNGGNNAFVIVLALGVLLASLVLVRPAPSIRKR